MGDGRESGQESWVQTNAAKPLSVKAAAAGGGTVITAAQVTVGVAETVLVAAATDRRAVTFVNHSSVRDVFIGPPGVTAATGLLLGLGGSATFRDASNAAYSAIAVGGSATVGVLVEKD